MLFPFKALRIELVHIFCSGGSGGEPAILRHDFQPADCRAVAWGLGEHRDDLVTRKLCGLDLIG